MIFIAEGWFEFKGVKSSDMGIRLQSMPNRSHPGIKAKRQSVAGRDGGITYGDMSFDDASVSIQCDVRDTSNLLDVLAWLTGEGPLRFSDEPDLAYDAHILSGFTRSSIAALMTGQRFTVEWVCAPFRRQYPEAADLVFTAPGTFTNPGTAPSLPRITITGSGAFSLTIGMQTAFFTGVDGGIIIDSELGDALTPDGAQLANDKMTGELFKIQPGYNTISAVPGGEDDEGNHLSGTVSRITITPRWRYI